MFEENRVQLAQQLLVTHPVLQQALNVWAKHSSTLLVDCAALARLPRPTAQQALSSRVRTDIDTAEDRLNSGCVSPLHTCLFFSLLTIELISLFCFLNITLTSAAHS